MQFYFSSLIQSLKNKEKLYTKVYFYLIGERYRILWWTILGLRWSQRGVCGSGYTHNAQKVCFSPKGRILPKNIALVWWQDFSEFSWIAANNRPNGLLSALNISWHSPVFHRDGCIFCGRQSNPGVLSAWHCPCSLRMWHWSQVTEVITGITCHLLSPSLYFLLSLECTHLKRTWSFVFCRVQPSVGECAQVYPAVPAKVSFAFLPQTPLLPCPSSLYVAQNNRHWKSRLEVWSASN